MPAPDSFLSELSEFFSPEEAEQWLRSPHRLLGEETPLDRINRGRGEDVLALIRQLLDGAFV